MRVRSLVMVLLTLSMAGSAVAADYPRRGYPSRVYRAPRPGPIRIVPNCENGDEDLVLRCDPHVAVLRGRALAEVRRETVELAVSFRRRPYEQLFTWGR